MNVNEISSLLFSHGFVVKFQQYRVEQIIICADKCLHRALAHSFLKHHMWMLAGWLAGCWHLWSLLAVAYYYVVHLAEFSKGGGFFSPNILPPAFTPLRLRPPPYHLSSNCSFCHFGSFLED
jgi:hypothetical protein